PPPTVPPPPAPLEPPSSEPPPDDGHGGHGGPAAPVPVDRQYRTDGFGDTLLGLRYTLWGAAASRLNAGLAVKLPTGASQIENTFDGGLHDPMLQPGSGSLDYILLAQYLRGGSGPLAWTASVSHQIATENDLHYAF